MEEIFAQTGQTEEIRKKLSLRLNDYVRSIPESFMLQLEEQARLHLSLGRLAAFPFASFFRYFNCVLGDVDRPEVPAVRACPGHAHAGPHGEAPRRLRPSPPQRPRLPVRRGAHRLLPLPRAGLKPGAEGGEDKIAAELGQLRADVLALAKEIDAFEAAVPLLDLLRYFRRDPWYQLMLNPPRLYLKNLYFTTLKTRLGVELEERLGTIKERVIDRKMQELLKGQRLIGVQLLPGESPISISASSACRTFPASAA